MGGAGGVETLHQADDFFIAHVERRHLHVAAVGDCEVMAVGVAGGDPDRGMRLLDGLGGGGGFGELPELTIMFVVALPQFLHGGDQFTHHQTGIPRIQTGAQTVVFIAIGAARDAEVEAAIHDEIGHRGLASQFDRVPERGDDIASAKADVFGAAGEVDEVQERVRCNGEIHAVMLASPDGVHAALVGHLAELDHLFIQPLLRFFGVDPFHMDKEREFHGLASLLVFVAASVFGVTGPTFPEFWVPK